MTLNKKIEAWMLLNMLPIDRTNYAPLFEIATAVTTKGIILELNFFGVNKDIGPEIEVRCTTLKGAKKKLLKELELSANVTRRRSTHMWFEGGGSVLMTGTGEILQHKQNLLINIKDYKGLEIIRDFHDATDLKYHCSLEIYSEGDKTVDTYDRVHILKDGTFRLTEEVYIPVHNTQREFKFCVETGFGESRAYFNKMSVALEFAETNPKSATVYKILENGEHQFHKRF